MQTISSVTEPAAVIFRGVKKLDVSPGSDKEFDNYINGLFEDLGYGKNIILSIADTTPPGAKFERIERVTKKAREFTF